jgi:hypothetical protein
MQQHRKRWLHHNRRKLKQLHRSSLKPEHNRRMNHSCFRRLELMHSCCMKIQQRALPSDPGPGKQCVSSELEQSGKQFVCQFAVLW